MTNHTAWSKNANIYEVNIRQYTKEGTINAFRKHLSRLKDMAVDIIWIMPVQPIGFINRKGTLGSYYSIRDYTSMNPEFGTLDDFRSMILEAHEYGMHVLLDWVANHTAWDHVWTIGNPDFYQKDQNGKLVSPWDWTDVVALNYESPHLRSAMISAMKFWLQETGIDGFRCDMAGMVPVDFWEEARSVLEIEKPIFMLAEDEEVIKLLVNAFDMNFTWEMHHLMNAVAKGDKKASDIWNKYQEQLKKYPEESYRMYFTSNHDENSHSGTAVERMGTGAEAFALLTYILPGMPLIYSGQETRTEKRLQFFDKDEIDWRQVPLHEFYKSLNLLKRKNSAIWCGPFGGKMVNINQGQNDLVFGCVRENDTDLIVTVINLSKHRQLFTLDNDLLAGKYAEVFSGEEYFLGKGYTFDLKPWDYVLLTNK